MPFPRNYRPISANVRTPNPDDPVDMSVSPGMTNYTFGAEMANPGTYNQFLGSPDFEDIQQQFRPLRKIPPAPPMPQLETGYEPLEMDYASVTSKPYQIPQAEKPKPQQSYGTNRGGTGGAGRGVQLGKSQFDIGPQFSEPDTGMSIADLRMLDDKPWELDENTKADVAPGTSLEPQKDNVTDKMPDLNTPQGLYSALAKKYPEMLQQNLDQVQQARIGMEDVDALRDRGGLGSLFIAASKAASGAGSIGGKQAESIAEKIVTREDTLARQQLKDRLDVANENMQMNARAVDLAMKQINFADEREQYDPNSDVSQFARDFMRQEFGVKVPDNVPAYQLKQFMPAVVQKYQAEERARYQSALLGQKSTDISARLQSEKDLANIRAQSAKDVANIQAQARKDVQAMKPLPQGGTAKQTPQDKLQQDLVREDAKKYINRLNSIDKLQGTLKLWDEAQTEEQKVQIGQSVIKLLNDPENSDAVGAEEVKRLADELQPYSVWSAKGRPRLGRDLPAFKQKVDLLRQRLVETAKGQYDRINSQSPGLVKPPTGATMGTTGGGLTEAERARLQELRNKYKGQ